MTRRREIDRHRRKLTEIRDIMESMKTLAYLETHKLSRLIDSQHELVTNIEAMALDFLHFYPETLPTIEPAADLVLVIGSQRGFCGNFNEVLFEHLQLMLDKNSNKKTSLIVVGQKFQPHLDEMPPDTILLEGANIAEEIRFVVERLSHTLSEKNDPFMSLYVLYHGSEDNGIVTERLLPPFSLLREEYSSFTCPPLLNMTPIEFLLELTEYYLFSALHRVLYDSLMQENQFRAQHLENAVNHLDNKTSELVRKSNALRQEEIIEEIEVILLNSTIT